MPGVGWVKPGGRDIAYYFFSDRHGQVLKAWELRVNSSQEREILCGKHWGAGCGFSPHRRLHFSLLRGQECPRHNAHFSRKVRARNGAPGCFSPRPGAARLKPCPDTNLYEPDTNLQQLPIHAVRLLRAEGLHWLDAGGAAGWNESGNGGESGQHQNRRDHR